MERVGEEKQSGGDDVGRKSNMQNHTTVCGDIFGIIGLISWSGHGNERKRFAKKVGVQAVPF